MDNSPKPAPDDPNALEFPDWSGQKKRPASTLTLDDMHRYSEEMQAHLRSFPGYREQRMRDRCDVEFVLK